MRTPWPALVLLLCALIPVFLSAQQSAPPAASGPQSSQAATLLQQSIAAMTGGLPVTDVTMTGTMSVTIGTNTESGTITMVATAAGQGQVAISLPSDTRTEIRSLSAGGSTLTELGADGVPHLVNTQSALSPHPDWFYPPFVLSSGLSSPEYASSYAGEETQNSAPAQHLMIWLVGVGSSAAVASVRRPGQHDVYLDPSSLLPASMIFITHPYDPTNPDRQLRPDRTVSFDQLEEVRFSDYRLVQGRQVAFHIQTDLYLPNVTILSDIRLSSVTLNTGAIITAGAN